MKRYSQGLNMHSIGRISFSVMRRMLAFDHAAQCPLVIAPYAADKDCEYYFNVGCTPFPKKVSQYVLSLFSKLQNDAPPIGDGERIIFLL